MACPEEQMKPLWFLGLRKYRVNLVIIVKKKIKSTASTARRFQLQKAS